MPKTKMEELLFMVMMCIAMFAMMISYNQVMAAGTIEALTFRIIRNYTHERVPVPVVISVVAVCFVCPVASAVVTLLVRHVTDNFVEVWLAALSWFPFFPDPLLQPLQRIPFLFCAAWLVAAARFLFVKGWKTRFSKKNKKILKWRLHFRGVWKLYKWGTKYETQNEKESDENVRT